MFLEAEPEIQVVGEADNGEHGLAAVRERKPDVVLIDVLMLGLGGVAAAGAIRVELPGTQVVALSSAFDADSVRGMVQAGAVSYLSKDTDPDALRAAVHGAATGKVQLAPEAAAVLMRRMVEPEVEELSPRELDVLQLIAAGKTNKGIANALYISEKTVKTHVSSIIAKLGVESRTQAALVAVERGLVQSDVKSFANG
jgi:DNA-binding NarL/FixJ family response regulator